MLLVNPAAMGIPAAQANGTPIAWTRILIPNVYPLTQLGNTTAFARASNAPGYLATLPYTPTLPAFPGALRLADFQGGMSYIAGSYTPSFADLSGSLQFSDFSVGNAYFAGTYVPEAANLASSALYLDPLSAVYAAYQPLPANLQTPRIFFNETGAWGV